MGCQPEASDLTSDFRSLASGFCPAVGADLWRWLVALACGLGLCPCLMSKLSHRFRDRLSAEQGCTECGSIAVGTSSALAPLPNVSVRLVPVPNFGTGLHEVHVVRSCRATRHLMKLSDLHLGLTHARLPPSQRSLTMCDGYLANGDAPPVLDEDGWYRTGDLAVPLPGGKFRLVERTSEAVKLSNGCFVCPSRLEQQYERCPGLRSIVLLVDSRRTCLLAIAQAATEGSPPERQEVLAALVDIAREAELRSWEVPRDVHVTCDEWSAAAGHLTASGKVSRRGLRAAYAAALHAMEHKLARQEDALAGHVRAMLYRGAHVRASPCHLASPDAIPFLDSRAAVAFASALAFEFPGVVVPPALLVRATDPVSLAAQLVAAAHPQGISTAAISADCEPPATDRLGSVSAASCTIEWEKEATLPSDVTAMAPALPSSCQLASTVADGNRPRHYLLTGATGFLGSFVLQELLDTTPADIQLHCIVRAANNEAAGERLRQVALANQLSSVTDVIQWQRVVPVAGDVSSARFGLSPAAYEALSAAVRCVVHCAAEVHMLRPYLALRVPNVLGTLHVLRFVCHATTPSAPKTLCYASTTSVLRYRPCPEQHADLGQQPSNEPIALEQLDSCSGYVQSKVVAERLVIEAARRGLNVGVVRMARVGPSSAGISNHRDLVSLLLAGVTELQMAPPRVEGTPIAFDMVPVETVAHAIVRMAFWTTLRESEGSCGPGMCHVTSCTQPVSWEQLLLDAEAARGVQIRRVTLPEWRLLLPSSEALRLLADELHDGIPNDVAFVSSAHDVPATSTLIA